MQDHRAVRRAAHARVGNTDHVLDALLEELLRNGRGAPLGHAGRSLGSDALQHEHGAFVHGEIRVVDPRVQIRVVLEDDGAAAVGQELLRGRRLLEHGAVGAQIALEDDRAALV